MLRLIDQEIRALERLTNDSGDIAERIRMIYSNYPDEVKALSERTVRSAQIFIGALPIIIVYPFLQKYFVKGIVLGSVKE